MKIEFLIAYSSFGSIIIPLTFALLDPKNSWSTHRPLLLILIGSLLADATAWLLMKQSINTYLVLNLYLIFQCSLLISFLKRELRHQRIINLTQGSFLTVALINITFFQGPWVFNSVTNVIACLILMIIPLVYFYKLLTELPIVHVQHLPMLWIAFGVITYYAGNFFLFLVKNYLVYGEAGSHRYMWILHNLLNIFKNILFAVGLWLSYRKAKSSILSS